jgi:hypothetical protein
MMNSSNCRQHVSLDGKGYGEHKWGFFCALLKGHKGEHGPYPETSRQGITVSDAMVTIKGKIKKLSERSTKLHAQQSEELKKTLITCLGWSVGGGGGDWSGCGAQFPVNQLTYIQTHWYTSPYSCSGGDYWNQGEGQFKCPSCGHINRLYERPDVAALKQFFAKVEDTYDR